MSSKKSASKKQQITETKNKAAVSKATGLDVTSVLGGITQASLNVQKTFGNISTALLEKAAELQAVEHAIDVKKQELSDLHGADKILLSIDELNVQHQQELEKLAAERDKAKADLELEQAIEEQRRLREEEQYRYDLQQSRKNESDTWTEAVRVRNRDEQIRRESFDKSLAEREAELAKKEGDYQKALARFENIETEISAASKREVAIATSSLNKDFEHRTQLKDIQHKAEVEKLQTTNSQLVILNQGLENQVKELQAQLKEAYAKNAELATKAVDGAANAKAQADALSTLANLGSSNGTRART